MHKLINNISIAKVSIINGPNLNLLGIRDNNIYGNKTLLDLESLCESEAKKLGLQTNFFQSNSEGDIISYIQFINTEHEKNNNFKGIIINPGAYSHTSIAIMDTILDSKLPVIEVHISNIHKREDFRQHSYTAKAARGCITGFGFNSYLAALYLLSKN